MKKINIAIDGPSGAGKSSICKKLAEILNYNFINSGLIYRLFAHIFTVQKYDLTNFSGTDKLIFEKKLIDFWSQQKVDIKSSDTLFFNGKNVSLILKENHLSALASRVAQISIVRKLVAEFLKKKTNFEKGIIMDGRDIATKIMPTAELKIFLFAKPEIRAKRRLQQNQKLGLKQESFDKILAQIIKRDYEDETRKIDPLKIAKEAYLIDSSFLNFDQVLAQILLLVKNKTT